MFNWTKSYDNWLAGKKPVTWLCRWHIVLPLVFVLFLISTLLTFIVPVWTNFNIIILINIFFGLIVIFLFYRFQFFYYDKSLTLGQHFRLYLFNTSFLLVIGVFVVFSPYLMQKRMEAKFGKAQLYYEAANYDVPLRADSLYYTGPAEVQPSLAFIKDSILAKVFYVSDDALNVGGKIYYRNVMANIETLMLGSIDTGDIAKIAYNVKALAHKFDLNKRTEYPYSEYREKKLIDIADSVMGGKINHNNYYKKYNVFDRIGTSLYNVLARSLYLSKNQLDSVKHQADSVKAAYYLPRPLSSDFGYLVNTYFPDVANKGVFIDQNLTIGDYEEKDFAVLIMGVIILLVINTYGMIILLSQNRVLGFTSPFVLLLVYIIIYSTTFISSAYNSLSYVLTFFGVIIVSFILAIIFNKRIRFGPVGQVAFYVLNFIACLLFWVIVIYFYEEASAGHSAAARGLMDLINWLNKHPGLHITALLLLYFTAALFNLPFIKHYYNKLIRPRR
jgi:hypothetical protein